MRECLMLIAALFHREGSWTNSLEVTPPRLPSHLSPALTQGISWPFALRQEAPSSLEQAE